MIITRVSRAGANSRIGDEGKQPPLLPPLPHSLPGREHALIERRKLNFEMTNLQNFSAGSCSSLLLRLLTTRLPSLHRSRDVSSHFLTDSSSQITSNVQSAGSSFGHPASLQGHTLPVKPKKKKKKRRWFHIFS